MARHTLAALLAGLAMMVGGDTARAQANFSESFSNIGDASAGSGGPSTLIARGWTFRNQSRPRNGVSPYWTELPGWGETDSALGHGGFAVWQDNTSMISAWIILPAVPNQRAGDPLSVFTSGTQSAFGENSARLEIRYAPTGGTSTGSSETSIGDFSTLLDTVAGPHAWTRRTYSLPGAGRIAFRLVAGPGPSSAALSGGMLIDSLQVGTPPPPPVPMPAAGQTVRWTTSVSPITLARNGAGQNPTIVAGGVVQVDPGVEIRFAAGAQLQVVGTLDLNGVAGNPVRLRGPGSLKVAATGLLTADFADVESYTDLANGARAAFNDSAFRDPALPTTLSYHQAGDIGHRFTDGNLSPARQILSLTRCTFGQGCSISLLRGWIAARDSNFFRGGVSSSTNPGPVGGEAMYVQGGALLHNVTVTDGYIDLLQSYHQHRFIGDTTVTGNPYGPGIRLQGGASFLIDPSVTLQGHRWPVALGTASAGILPGSRLPAAGNQFNEIPDTTDASPLNENVIWADAGIPYVTTLNQTSHGQLTILPNVTVKVGPNASFFFDTDSHGLSYPQFLGEPGRPIRFIPYTPGTRWTSIAVGNTRWLGVRWQWCEFEGSLYGAGAASLPIAFDHCVFRDNIRGAGGSSSVSLRSCRFENNVFSYSGERFAPNHIVEGFLDANHPSNPNSFINNRGTPPASGEFFGTFLASGGLLASVRHNSLQDSDSDVRNNWWGTPTGPRHPTFNPGGTGDDVYFGPDAGGLLLPFLPEPPVDNPSPVVRFISRPTALVPGSKIHFTWTARDDGSIVAQRVYFSQLTNIDDQMQLVAEIPADARSFEWTVPAIGSPAHGSNQYFRVIAVDELGREGIADLPFFITNPSPFTGAMIPNPAITGERRPGERVDVCASVSGLVGSMYAALEFDNDETGLSLGGLFGSSTACAVLGGDLPDVSTDRARLRYDATGPGNQVRSFYGPWFSIRPDPLIADAPPVVALTSVHAGQAYPTGSVVSIAWTASDDESLRGFDIRASFDGGTQWVAIARDLPADARGYSWRLPGSAGVSTAMLRVVAKDRRFQNSSAESGPFSILAGGYAPSCPSDFNADGAVTLQDIFDFLAAYFAVSAAADINDSGDVTVQDIFHFLAGYFAGC